VTAEITTNIKMNFFMTPSVATVLTRTLSQMRIPFCASTINTAKKLSVRCKTIPAHRYDYSLPATKLAELRAMHHED